MSSRIKNMEEQILSEKFFKLSEIEFDYRMKNGDWVKNKWEVLDRGNAAAALLYNKTKRTIILVKQFRIPAYLNGIETGFLLEVPAGSLDKKDISAAEAMKRELLEETGYKVSKLDRVYDAFATPGGSTERFSCFIGEYNNDMKVAKGGGLDSENEDIEIIEMPFNEAIEQLKSGNIVDAKTIILLQYAQINGLID